MQKEKILRRLVIRAFHTYRVEMGEKIGLNQHVLTLSTTAIAPIVDQLDLVVDMTVRVLPPGDTNYETNTIMDVIPISTKVLGIIGEGITHTMTGAYVLLTGADENGMQMAEFGSSEGNLNDKLSQGKAGTPSKSDWIIHIDVKLKGGQIYDRNLPLAAFKACDLYIQNIRKELKKKEPKEADESHEFFDKIRPGKKKVVIIKQIAGQGAMYDNQLFSDEPSGLQGGRSIIDLGNVPVIISPNEYRDGAIRAMT